MSCAYVCEVLVCISVYFFRVSNTHANKCNHDVDKDEVTQAGDQLMARVTDIKLRLDLPHPLIVHLEVYIHVYIYIVMYISIYIS